MNFKGKLDSLFGRSVRIEKNYEKNQFTITIITNKTEEILPEIEMDLAPRVIEVVTEKKGSTFLTYAHPDEFGDQIRVPMWAKKYILIEMEEIIKAKEIVA